MKKTAFLLSLLFAFLMISGSALADEALFNPSFYSAGEIAYEIRNYWQANPHEIQELMNSRSDFRCVSHENQPEDVPFDQIICTSVNNQFARDVIINFWFDGDYNGMPGLREAVFNVTTPDTESVQEVLEYFWIENAFPWHQETDYFYDFAQSLIFQSSTTTMRFDLANVNAEGEKITTIDFWNRESSRMAVG